MANDTAYNLLHQYNIESQSFVPEKISKNSINEINEIISGTHLTFRYILLTALLGKVTDKKNHMRSLQAGSDLKGAYDARSLCHSVIVPYEKKELFGKLGSSNEPFLNKPARFTSVDKSNPVRRGNDKRLLDMLYDLLERLNDESEDIHREALLVALSCITQRKGNEKVEIDLPAIVFSQVLMMKFINQYLTSSMGGESAASLTGALFKVFSTSNKSEIIVHPANQAGSSSNEIGDIDIKINKKFHNAIEVKDKNFTKSDISHAVDKVRESGNTRLLFVIGPSAGKIDWKMLDDFCLEYAKSGFDLTFTSLVELSYHLIAIFSVTERRELIQIISSTLTEMRATDPSRENFDKCLRVFR